MKEKYWFEEFKQKIGEISYDVNFEGKFTRELPEAINLIWIEYYERYIKPQKDKSP